MISENIYLSRVIERYPKFFFFFFKLEFSLQFAHIPADQLTSILLNMSAGVD